MHAGKGGEEARLFAEDLSRMYLRWCEANNVRTELYELKRDSKGVRAATYFLKGQKAKLLQKEAGVHKIQNVTRTRKQNKVHTSHAVVKTLPPAASFTGIEMKDVEITAFRASGPGGQHRNKTENAIRAAHKPTGATATVDGRSKEQNRRRALQLLAARVRMVEAAADDRERSRLRAKQTDPVRTYDQVRDMVRAASGMKLRNVKKVLDGNLDALLG